MEETEFKKYKELWAILWSRYFKIINYKVNVRVPRNIHNKYQFRIRFGNNFALSANIEVDVVNNTYEGYTYSIKYNESDDEIFHSRKSFSKTTNSFSNKIYCKKEHVKTIYAIIEKHDKRSYINIELDKLCRYIHAFSTMMDKTDYIKHISSARIFMLCSRTTFPKDISKIIYKKILFFKN